MDIGHRLKAVRTTAALSQRELAKRSGVTNGFISQIEKNQVSPSVSSLRKVLEGIPMSLASFFTEETEMSTEVIFRAADMPDLGTHPISYRLVGHSRANRAIGMLQEVLPPERTPTTAWSWLNKPLPEDPASVTPAENVTPYTRRLFPMPAMLVVMRRTPSTTLMRFSSPPGWWMTRPPLGTWFGVASKPA